MTTNQAMTSSLQRLRQRRRRVDYYPSADAAAIIESAAIGDGKKCISEVIDSLVTAGLRTVSGNSGDALPAPAFDWGTVTVSPIERDWR